MSIAVSYDPRFFFVFGTLFPFKFYSCQNQAAFGLHLVCISLLLVLYICIKLLIVFQTVVFCVLLLCTCGVICCLCVGGAHLQAQSNPLIYRHQEFSDARTQKLCSLLPCILYHYYLRPLPPSPPSFVGFLQELCVWLAIKHAAESHDIMDKHIDFRTARSKAQEMLGFE